MNKLFPIVLALMCFGFAEERAEIIQRYLSGEKKVIAVYEGSNAFDEKLKA